MTLVVKPEIEKKYNDTIVKDKSLEKVEVKGIEDYVKPKVRSED